MRMAYIKESKVLDLQGPILHDLFQVKRYILSQVGIRIKFHRSRPDFCLLSNEAKKYKIDIEEMALRVCKVQVNPEVITAHNAMLRSTNAKCPYTKTEMASMNLAFRGIKYFQIPVPTGSSSLSFAVRRRMVAVLQRTPVIFKITT